MTKIHEAVGWRYCKCANPNCETVHMQLFNQKRRPVARLTLDLDDIRSIQNQFLAVLAEKHGTTPDAEAMRINQLIASEMLQQKH